MRIIIAGSRDFCDYKLLEAHCTKIIDEFYWQGRITSYMDLSSLEIISGTARGADQLGEKFARDRNFDICRMPANWDIDGKSAGYKRNEKMAQYASKDDGVLIAFWDGKSKGTKHMIDIAKKYKLQVFVIRFDQEKNNE
jgi:hypothetical protein